MNRNRSAHKPAREYKFYILSLVFFLVIPYFLYLIPNKQIIYQVGAEDGLFEYLTALFFLGSSIFFMRAYISHKNWFFIVLATLMFFGAGEEISWGQRILGLSTPDVLNRINVQGELTLHNIEALNSHYFDGTQKTGLAKLFTINTLYKIFCVVYAVLLPIASLTIQPVASLSRKLRLPIPPLAIGAFFLINLLGTNVVSFLLPANEAFQYYDTRAEIAECASAFIFLVLSFYFSSNNTP